MLKYLERFKISVCSTSFEVCCTVSSADEIPNDWRLCRATSVGTSRASERGGIDVAG